MSLYHEAALLLQAPTTSGGSLKARIFTNKSLKSPPAQLYALVIESCKWSPVLKEVVENSSLLTLEKKLTPILSLLLVHDFLLAKKGIALPATHGLRMSIERHKARLQAELSKARLRRGKGSLDALKAYIESGEEDPSSTEPPHPRWIRINTLKTQLEDQLESTFKEYELVQTIEAVRKRGSTPRLHIDQHIPNLVATSPSVDLSKSKAYLSGAIIFQDKASCFPAYLLDPLPQDGDIMDTCAAPGNKTTHLAAILKSHLHDQYDNDSRLQRVHAFEKDKHRAVTLQKMVALAGSESFTTIHAGQDFLQVNPQDLAYKDVTALLLDPSCSGSGIIGRDDMPTLHLPDEHSISTSSSSSHKSKSRPKSTKPKHASDPPKKPQTLKRKHSESDTKSQSKDSPEPTPVPLPLLLLDDDGTPLTSANAQPQTAQDLQLRLDNLAAFQLSLLLHAFAFPSARKITYSTCSVHFTENENVVLKALASPVAKERGWRVLRRTEQVSGLRMWDVRGDREGVRRFCSAEGEGKESGFGEEVTEACIRAEKADPMRGTMGFFVCGFLREDNEAVVKDAELRMEREFLRDEKGRIVRDLLGMPVRVGEMVDGEDGAEGADGDKGEEEDEWNGFDDDDENQNTGVKDQETSEDDLKHQAPSKKRKA